MTAAGPARSNPVAINTSKLMTAAGPARSNPVAVNTSKLITAAEQAIEAQQWSKAVELLDKVLEQGPDGRALAMRGRANIFLRHHKSAFHDLSRAIEMDRNDHRPFLYRAKLFVDMRYPKEAISDCTQSIARRPTPEAHKLRARCLCKVKRYDEAAVDYQSAIRLLGKRAPPEIWNDLADTFYKISQQPKAVEAYTEGIAQNPKSSLLFFGRARIYRDQRQWNKAISDLDQAIALEPIHNDAYETRADCFMRVSRYKEAIADYTQSIKLAPSNKVRRLRAHAYELTGEYKKAIADCDAIIGEKDGDDQCKVYLTRERCYAHLGQWQKTIADCTSYLARRPDFIDVLEDRAAAYDKLGKHDLAVKDRKQIQNVSVGVVPQQWKTKPIPTGND